LIPADDAAAGVGREPASVYSAETAAKNSPTTWRMDDARDLEIAAEHDQQHAGTPKVPGEPKRVQPSKDRDRL
jgi:hypothetical protein